MEIKGDNPISVIVVPSADRKSVIKHMFHPNALVRSISYTGPYSYDWYPFVNTRMITFIGIFSYSPSIQTVTPRALRRSLGLYLLSTIPLWRSVKTAWFPWASFRRLTGGPLSPGPGSTPMQSCAASVTPDLTYSPKNQSMNLSVERIQYFSVLPWGYALKP